MMVASGSVVVESLSLVVPAFEEEARLPRTLEAASLALPELARDAEIVVVDDGSRDRTAEVARSYRGAVPVHVVALPRNRGKGAAVGAGIAAARCRFVAFTDADCPYDLGSLRSMLGALEQGRADVAIGARELPDSQVNRGYGALRFLSGKAFSYLTWLAIGLPFRDSQCGLKAFRRETARSLFATRTIDRFGFDFEILAAAVANDLRVERFPVRLTHDDDSRIRLVHDSLDMLRELLRVRRNLRRGWYRFGAGGEGGIARGVRREPGSCPVCAADEFAPRAVRAGYRMVECMACGVWHLSPMPSRAELERFYDGDYFASPESTAAGYGDYAASADDLTATFRRRLAWLRDVPEGARLLDLGGGFGYLADAAASDSRFSERWVVETSADAAARVSSRHHVVVGWFPDVALPPASFDVVSLQDCLEHLLDPRAALARIREILKPGGSLLLTTPNTASLTARLQGQSWISLKFPEHVILYSAASLMRLLGEEGFRVERLERASQHARLGFLATRAAAAWPSLARRAAAALDALGLAEVGLWVPSGSVTVLARAVSGPGGYEQPARDLDELDRAG